MSNTDRIRAYYNLHRKCFSVQDYQTGLVSEHTYQLFVTNAMFVVRKSGNERVKQEGKKKEGTREGREQEEQGPSLNTSTSGSPSSRRKICLRIGRPKGLASGSLSGQPP